MQKLYILSSMFLLASMAAVRLAAQTTPADLTPHFNHTTIYVVDLEKSASFYENVMLLSKIAEPFHDSKHVWFKMGEHSQLHVVKGATGLIAHDINIHLAFSVHSFDAFREHLEKMNIKFGNYKGDGKIIQMRPDNVKQIYLQDPEGYWIEVNDDQF